eukprot:1646424-Prymnesium_polylepis.2
MPRDGNRTRTQREPSQGKLGIMDANTLGLACALADIAIYKPADFIELAREGVLNELVVTTAGDLERRAALAASVQSAVADRRAARVADAEAMAAEADRRRMEAE